MYRRNERHRNKTFANFDWPALNPEQALYAGIQSCKKTKIQITKWGIRLQLWLDNEIV